VKSCLETFSCFFFFLLTNCCHKVAIEALSVSLDKQSLDQSVIAVRDLGGKVRQMEQQNNARLNEEYQRLCSSFGASINSGGGWGGGGGGGGNSTSSTSTSISTTSATTTTTTTTSGDAFGSMINNPMLSPEILEEQMPGNIRKAKHFVSIMNNVVQFLKAKLGSMADDAAIETPSMFVHRLNETTHVSLIKNHLFIIFIGRKTRNDPCLDSGELFRCALTAMLCTHSQYCYSLRLLLPGCTLFSFNLDRCADAALCLLAPKLASPHPRGDTPRGIQCAAGRGGLCDPREQPHRGLFSRAREERVHYPWGL
jgi:hypothetical protein